MYNLLVTSQDGAWEQATYTMMGDRYLGYTHELIQQKFRPLTDNVIAQLKAMPTLFTYEKFLKAPARVGRLIEIHQLTRDIRVTLSLDPLVPPIPVNRLELFYRDLDIDSKYEVNTTHWAIKNVDLAEVLASAGIITAAHLQPQPRPPKVFISYSWDSPEHRQWVSQLAVYLRSKGIDVILDQWHLRGGMDVAVFMRQSVQEADRVLVVCTPTYVEKASRGTGGVGFEHMIISGQLMKDLGTTKFIPIVVDGKSPALPAELATRLFYNLGAGEDLQARYDALVRELHGIEVPLPPLGRNPFRRE